uniref:Sema domain-containing protein n=1 Tax=Tetranychus urticae TaxID=32264 RepID=A0A158P4Z5_TETUR
MFIPNLITIMQLVLSIEYSYSFRRFTHTHMHHYKALDSVSSRSYYELTSYDIYVAGKTITVDIPRSVVNVSDIVNWKVVNLDKNKLVFVHKNKPQILIDQKTIKNMTYSGYALSDSIIVFSDNEALHVPTIFNPNLTEPFPKWNYIELLYFDDQSEEVSVLRSLPMLKDDWKYIKEWKMMDYIHFDDKLYLLIMRSIWNEKNKNVTKEISIIRLCLNKGTELISSAVEIRYKRPEFQTNQITGAIFICVTFYKPEKILLLITKQASNQTFIYTRYPIDHFVSLFDETGQGCASGANNYTLMRYHLRSEVRSCQKTTYKKCSSNKNTVPSVELNFDGIWPYHFFFNDGTTHHAQIEYATNHTLTINGSLTRFCHKKSGWDYHCFYINKKFTTFNSIHKVEAFCQGYPNFRFYLMFNSLRYNETRHCYQVNGSYLSCYTSAISEDDIQLHNYFNHRPFNVLRVTKNTNQIISTNLWKNFCFGYKSCIHCMMYGVSRNCIWYGSGCKQEIKNDTQTIDYCFKIARISPLIFNSSSPETLTIEFDRPLKLTDTQEYLDIKAGPHNDCTNIKPNPNGLIFNCSMRLSVSGKFKISVSLRNDRYADAITLSSLSTEKVDVVVPEVDYLPTIILLVLGLALTSLIVYVGFKKQQSKDQQKVSTRKVTKFSDSKEKQGFAEAMTAVTRVKSKIMKITKDSTIQKEPSSKLVKSQSSMPSVSKQLDVSKSKNSSPSLKSTKDQKSTKIAVKTMQSKSLPVVVKSKRKTKKSKSSVLKKPK